MIEPFLQKQLEPVARRIRRFRLWQRLTVCWGVAALLGLLLVGVERQTGWAPPWVLPLFFLGVALAARILWRQNAAWQPDYREIARRIESQKPELHALLLTAIEQRPDPVTGQFNFLQERVLQEAILESRRASWVETVPASRMRLAQVAHMASLAMLASLLFLLRAPSGPLAADPRRSQSQGGRTSVTVTPGDASVERGTPLALLARFEGPLPASVTLTLAPMGNTATAAEAVKRIPLAKSLADPVFATTLSEVTADFAYRVEYPGGATRDYRISVFEYPRLERADARITYPPYTRLPEKVIADTRRISAVEGSRVQFDFHLNKLVRRAALVARDRSELLLSVATNAALARLDAYLLTNSQTFELRLVDLDGRTNRTAPQFVFEALSNRRPEIHITSPRGDQRISPLEEVQFTSELWDDFGLLGYGLAYRLPGHPEQTVGVVTNSGPNEKRIFSHLLAVEAMKLEPGSLLSWYVWADDIGPDGEVPNGR